MIENDSSGVFPSTSQQNFRNNAQGHSSRGNFQVSTLEEGDSEVHGLNFDRNDNQGFRNNRENFHNRNSSDFRQNFDNSRSFSRDFSGNFAGNESNFNSERNRGGSYGNYRNPNGNFGNSNGNFRNPYDAGNVSSNFHASSNGPVPHNLNSNTMPSFSNLNAQVPSFIPNLNNNNPHITNNLNNNLRNGFSNNLQNNSDLQFAAPPPPINSQGPGQARAGNVVCYRCGKLGHPFNLCTVHMPNVIFCYGCGFKGVIKRNCPHCTRRGN
jgi:hypothetical protein